MKPITAFLTFILSLSASAGVRTLHCAGHLSEIVATLDTTTLELINIKHFSYYMGKTSKASLKKVDIRFQNKTTISYDLPQLPDDRDSTWLDISLKGLKAATTGYAEIKGTLVTEASCTEEIYKSKLNCYLQ